MAYAKNFRQQIKAHQIKGRRNECNNVNPNLFIPSSTYFGSLYLYVRIGLSVASIRTRPVPPPSARIPVARQPTT